VAVIAITKPNLKIEIIVENVFSATDSCARFIPMAGGIEGCWIQDLRSIVGVVIARQGEESGDARE